MPTNDCFDLKNGMGKLFGTSDGGLIILKF